MTQRLVVLAALLALFGPQTVAQTMSADEKAIRDLVAAMSEGKALPQTDDAIFWSGAFKTPFVRGGQRSELIDHPVVRNRVPNTQKVKTTVRRIEFAQSGEMAYEFSDAEVTFDMANGQSPRTDKTSALRVWKKVNGQWRVAAWTDHVHDAPTAMGIGAAN